jgi:hypothetical protein
MSRNRRSPAVTAVVKRRRAIELVPCEVDGSSATEDAVRAAIARCKENGAGLALVGVLGQMAGLESGTSSEPRAEQARRVSQSQRALIRAIGAARDAGIPVEVATRCC